MSLCSSKGCGCDEAAAWRCHSPRITYYTLHRRGQMWPYFFIRFYGRHIWRHHRIVVGRRSSTVVQLCWWMELPGWWWAAFGTTYDNNKGLSSLRRIDCKIITSRSAVVFHFIEWQAASRKLCTLCLPSATGSYRMKHVADYFTGAQWFNLMGEMVKISMSTNPMNTRLFYLFCVPNQ